jgi:hypothetical protein
MSLFSVLKIIYSLTSGTFNFRKYVSSGKINLKSDETPIKSASMVLIECVFLIFYVLVFYSIYVEDILNIPAP